MSRYFLTPFSYNRSTGLKPYFLWEFPKEEKELCPVSAFAAWIEASDLKNSTGYIFRAPTTTGRAPPSMNNSPIVSCVVLIFSSKDLIDQDLRFFP